MEGGLANVEIPIEKIEIKQDNQRNDDVDLRVIPMEIEDSAADRKKLKRSLKKKRKKMRELEKKIRRKFAAGIELGKQASNTIERELKEQLKRQAKEMVNLETDQLVQRYRAHLIKYRQLLNHQSWQLIEKLSIKEIKHRIVFQKHNFKNSFFTS